MERGPIDTLMRPFDRMQAVDRLIEEEKNNDDEEEEKEEEEGESMDAALHVSDAENDWEKMLCSGFTELGIKEERERCLVHRGNALDWYCEEHELACCGTCAIQSHGPCKEILTYIPDKTKGIRKSIEYFEILSTLKSSIDKLNHLRDQYETDKSTVTEEKEKALVAKNAFRQRLEELLDGMDETTETELREKHGAIQDDIDVAIERVDESVGDLEDILKKIETKEGNSGFKTFLDMKIGKKVICNADELLAMPKEREEITCVTYTSIEGTLRAFGGYWGLVYSTQTHECSSPDTNNLCDTVIESQNGEREEDSTSHIRNSVIPFDPLIGQDTRIKNGVKENITTKLQCITAMKEYEDTSFEELRTEEYAAAIEDLHIFGPSASSQSGPTSPSIDCASGPATRKTSTSSDSDSPVTPDAQSEQTNTTTLETHENSVTNQSSSFPTEPVSPAAPETERITSTTQASDTMFEQTKLEKSITVTHPSIDSNDMAGLRVPERHGTSYITQPTDIPTEDAEANSIEEAHNCTTVKFPDIPSKETVVATEVLEQATTELQEIRPGETESVASSEKDEIHYPSPSTGTTSRSANTVTPEMPETRNTNQHTDSSTELAKSLSSGDTEIPISSGSDRKLEPKKSSVSESSGLSTSSVTVSRNASSDQSTSEPVKTIRAVDTKVVEPGAPIGLPELRPGETKTLASKTGELHSSIQSTGTAPRSVDPLASDIPETLNITQHTDTSSKLAELLSSAVTESSQITSASDLKMDSGKSVVSERSVLSTLPVTLSPRTSSDQSTSVPVKVMGAASQVSRSNSNQGNRTTSGNNGNGPTTSTKTTKSMQAPELIFGLDKSMVLNNPAVQQSTLFKFLQANAPVPAPNVIGTPATTPSTRFTFGPAKPMTANTLINTATTYSNSFMSSPGRPDSSHVFGNGSTTSTDTTKSMQAPELMFGLDKSMVLNNPAVQQSTLFKFLQANASVVQSYGIETPAATHPTLFTFGPTKPMTSNTSINTATTNSNSAMSSPGRPDSTPVFGKTTVTLSSPFTFGHHTTTAFSATGNTSTTYLDSPGLGQGGPSTSQVFENTTVPPVSLFVFGQGKTTTFNATGHTATTDFNSPVLGQRPQSRPNASNVFGSTSVANSSSSFGKDGLTAPSVFGNLGKVMSTTLPSGIGEHWPLGTTGKSTVTTGSAGTDNGDVGKGGGKREQETWEEDLHEVVEEAAGEHGYTEQGNGDGGPEYEDYEEDSDDDDKEEADEEEEEEEEEEDDITRNADNFRSTFNTDTNRMTGQSTSDCKQS